MSNLFKPWSVQTASPDARVIDSNERMMEYLKRNGAYQGTPESSRGAMAEGIAAEGESNVIKAEPEVDHVALAKEQAEQILADANAQAEAVVARAHDEAASVEEEAREKGYAEGQERLEQEFEARRTELETAYRDKEQALAEDYRRKQKGMEREIVDALVPVFDKVFHIQFADKHEILLYLIDHAILNIEGEKHFRIRVAEGERAFLESHRQELLDRVGHDIELEILGDPGMSGSDCMIETDSGVFDCGLDTQLQNLMKDIRSLCS